MFLADASTKRPIAMSALLIGLIVLGLNSYRKFSLENLPTLDVPYVTVTTTWVGASPEDVEKDVSKRIEDAVSGIDGLKHIESSSLENVSIVALEFVSSVNVDVAAQDVREKLDTILADLPEDAERPVVQKLNINAQPIVNLFLGGEAPIDDLYDYADNQLADHFATVPGVAEVQVVGGNEREVWVELNREALAAAGLTTYDVAATLKSGILNLPAGRIREQGREFAIRFDAEYHEIPDIAALEIASKNGARLRLGDLGTVRQATQEVRQRAILDGKPGVVLKIVKKAEGNTVTVVRESRRRFEELRKTLPGGMALEWVSDESANVVATVDSALESVWQSVLLCAFILLFFLFNIRTTFIVAITMPVTICISLFFMQLAGLTLNTITLLAIGLSTGVLVSNSIVVLENIVGKFATLNDRWEAARTGTAEMTVAVLASAGTNVVVMFPIAMMTSIIGRVLVPFAVTTLIVNAASIFVSFTLTPILCALILKTGAMRSDSRMTRLERRWEAGFTAMAIRYVNGLRRIAGRKMYTLPIVLGFVLLFVFSLKLGGDRLGFTFFETQDFGRLFIRVETPPYYDLNKTMARLESIQARLMKFSDIDHVLTTAGKSESMSGQANEGVYMGQIELFFKPKTDRAWKILDRLTEIRTMLANEPDCLISASTPSVIGGQNFQIDFNLSGDDLDSLDRAALAIQAASVKLPGVSEINTTVRETKPEIRVLPRRTVLADLGLPASWLAATMRANIEGIKAANYKRGDRTYDIRVKLAERPGTDQIRQFLLPGADARPIPLETVANVVEARTKVQIFRVDKQRTVKLLGDIQPGAAMSTVGEEIAQRIAEKKLLPPGYSIRTSGMNEKMAESIADFGEAILIAIFLTLLTLAAILESWTRPGLVLLTLPMGLIGVIAAMILSHAAFTVLVLLGVLMLIGIVVNAAILIVDRTAQHLQAGMPRREAMLVAIVDEFRPVLMVVLASGLGMLPMAVSTGIGSESRAGIGYASVGGILVAGILTLTVLPLIYTLFTGKPQADHPGKRDS